MHAHPNGGSRRRTSSIVIFAALLGGGLLLLVVRLLARPDVSLGEIALPVLAGAVIAGALAVMVRRDRQDRRDLPPDERDRPDQGTPL